MSVKVNISPFLFQYTNNRQVVAVDGSTVGQCLNHLVREFPGLKQWLFKKNGKLCSYLEIYINEVSAYPDELAKPVKEGDVLDIVFIISGG